MSYSENGTTCRLCGLSCEQSINIFGRLDIVNMLQFKIKQLLNINVGLSDNLPHSVCTPCVSKLDSFWCFKNSCNQVQIKLRKLNTGTNLSVSNHIEKKLIHTRKDVTCVSDVEDNDDYNCNIEEDTSMSIASEEYINVECDDDISSHDPTLQRSSNQLNSSTSFCGDVENFEVDSSSIAKDTESCNSSSAKEQNDRKSTKISLLSATTSSKNEPSFKGHYYRMESDMNSDLLCNRIPYLLVESKMGTKHKIHTVSPVPSKFDIEHYYMLNFDVVYLTVETFDLENLKVVRTLIEWVNNLLKGKISLMPYYISWLDESNKLNLGFKCIICKAIKDTNRQSVMNHIADHLLCICPVCDRFHRCITNMKTHLLQHESVKFECSTCGDNFGSDFEKYKMHKRSHYKFECLTCWFECSNEMKWLEHLKEEKKKNCSTDCCLFYESIDEFREHVSELSTVGGYVCGACGMTYHCEEYLKLHLRVHGLEHGSKTTTEARLPESSGSQKEATKKVIDRLKNSHKNIQFETLNNILDNKIDLKQFQTSSTAPGGRVFTGFMCFKCSGILKTEKKFRIHIENHFMMTCHCKRDFHGIKRLRDHFQCCGFKRRICVQCRNDVWLNTTTEYLEHLSFHQKRRICIYCQQILPTTDKLVKHINSLHNTGETKEWFCEYCNETLVVSKSLDTFKFNHFKERHPDRLESFVCEVCGESFNKKKSLVTHTKVKHLGEKMYDYTFICAYCSKEFSSKLPLKSHILRHMNEKTFKCTICDKAFNRESSLYKHNLDMHSVKKHMCNVCGKRFSYPSELRNHVKKVHAYVKPARCKGTSGSHPMSKDGNTTDQQGVRAHTSGSHSMSKDGYTTDQQGVRAHSSGSHSMSKDGYTTDQQGVRAHSMSTFGYATDQPANVRDYPMSTNGCVTGQPGAHSMSADSQFQNPYPGMDYYFYDRPFPSVPRTDPLHQVTHDF